MNEVAFLLQNGFTLDEACSLDPLLRLSFIYMIQQQKGAKIDWKSGEISFK